MFGRIGFSFIVALAFSTLSFAQCVPDSSFTHNVYGIYPDSATGLPPAYVGVAYSTVMYVYVPVDTTYLSQPATIVSIQVTNVTGLPAGFSYTCTPSNCIFPGGSNACILIQGLAPTTGMIGTYPIQVDLLISGIVSGIPLTLQDNNDNYSIVIEGSTGLWSVSNGTFSVKQNSPNPFGRFTNIPVNSRINAVYSLKVTDLLGNVVLFQEREVAKGISNLSIDASNFEAGIYLYTISDGKNSITRRFVVSGKNEF